MLPTRAFVQAAAGRIRSHSFFSLLTINFCLCIVVSAVMAVIVWERRLAAIERADSTLRTLARAVADQTDRTIASMDLAETRLLEDMAHGQDDTTDKPLAFDSKQLYTMMRDIVSSKPEAYELLLADENGNLRNASHQWPAFKLNLVDRPYFEQARAHPDVASFVSEVVISGHTGKPAFNIVRRLSGPDGAFKGVLLGEVQASYLERLFAGHPFANGGSLTLFRADGVLLARYPSVPLEVSRMHEAALRTALLTANDDTFRRSGAFDDVESVTALGKLPRYNLIVAVSEPIGSVLAAWRVEAASAGGIAALGCLAMAAIVILAARRANSQTSLEVARGALKVDEERYRANQEIADQHLRTRMALDNMSQGLLMFDRSNCLLLANAAMHTIFGLPPGALKPGLSVRDIIIAMAKVGSIAPDRISKTIAFYLNLVDEDVAVRCERTLIDGRVLAANFAPYSKGWLMTYEDVTEVIKADERISYMALHDALTGLPNRIMFHMGTENALSVLRGNDTLAIIYLDLDQFKDVNDTLGHSVGDTLLCEVAKRIQSLIRHSDIVARLGGDEFAIVMSPVISRAAVTGLASHLVETISAPYSVAGQTVFVGVSLGITLAPRDGNDPGTLMKRTDLALYRAKGEGRGRFAFFEPSMEQHVVEKRRIERELHDALERGEFRLFYQPIIQIEGRRIIGFEALLRWFHPTRGMIPPTEFIPIAEENGFIVQIGQWALNTACLEAMQWPDDLKLAVNLSPVQFRSGKLVQVVAGSLAASGLAPRRLELEVTESTMMDNIDATLVILADIKALDVRIAMDDFGTGYSSLAYLQKFPFDKIKIDRAFIRDIGQATNLAIVCAVTGIAESMGITTTAEGVETEEQFAIVEEARCHEVQGYLFSPPRPPGEIPAMLVRQNSPECINGENSVTMMGA